MRRCSRACEAICSSWQWKTSSKLQLTPAHAASSCPEVSSALLLAGHDTFFLKTGSFLAGLCRSDGTLTAGIEDAWNGGRLVCLLIAMLQACKQLHRSSVFEPETLLEPRPLRHRLCRKCLLQCGARTCLKKRGRPTAHRGCVHSSGHLPGESCRTLAFLWGTSNLPGNEQHLVTLALAEFLKYLWRLLGPSLRAPGKDA